MKLLDTVGLNTLWSKIKSTFVKFDDTIIDTNINYIETSTNVSTILVSGNISTNVTAKGITQSHNSLYYDPNNVFILHSGQTLSITLNHATSSVIFLEKVGNDFVLIGVSSFTATRTTYVYIAIVDATDSNYSYSITGNSNKLTFRNYLLPVVNNSDDGKIMYVSGGNWVLTTPITVYTGTSTPSSTLGNNGDLYLLTA